MDFYSLGFIFAIVMVSGVIAYLADIYGRKLGKKRLSLFGMRPRHTAACSTVLLGMSLSMLTIGLVSLFSAPVRSWILEGRYALNQLNQAQKDLSKAEQNLKAAQQKEHETEQKIARIISNNKETLGKQGDEIAREQGNIASLQGIQGRLQSDLQETRVSLLDSTQKIHIDETKIDETDTKLQKNKNDLIRVKQELNTSSQRSRDLERTSGGLLKSNEKLSDDISHQKTELATLLEEKQELDKSKSDLEADLQTGNRDLADLQSKLHAETDKLAKVQEQYGELNTSFWANSQITRTSRMIYHTLQEVCRLAVPANLTAEEADNAIDSIIRKAQVEAEEHGAKADGTAKVADIMDRAGITAEQYKSVLKQKLTGNPKETVLIALSRINIFVDEPVSLDVVPLENPTIYKRGEKIGECDLDGNGSNQQIVKQLVAFGAKLREQAKQDKMIPQADSDSFGSLPADEVLGLVDEVKQSGRRVRLQAMVSEDTHAADPLKLNFRIR